MALVLADVVNRADIRMVESGGRPGLALETFDGERIGERRIGQELQRDVAAEAEVFGPVDDAHAACAQTFHHPVVRDCCADHRGNIAT